MHNDEFRKLAHQLVDWMVDYQSEVVSYPVKARVKPGEILKQLPIHPPNQAENFENIFEDFKNIIMPGISHWQHPNFHAYYPANTSPPSILAEMLTATLGLQCMSWQTSPAATELEECVIKWLLNMLGLPTNFDGVIQDSASTATLCSLLCAREQKTQYESNATGLYQQPIFTMYCSEEAHSSIEKAVKIAGLGSAQLRKIPVDENYAMRADLLEDAILDDIKSSFIPLWVVAALGTTGSTAMDPLYAIGRICQKYELWLHVDAAYAGTAFLLAETRHFLKGIEYADSFVFNPHKWMLTNFDCSVYFIKNKSALIKCFEILPEYLKTKEDKVNNYRDWSTTLGRRFRALKLWFVIRCYGITKLQAIIRNHIVLAQNLSKKIASHNDFEIMAPVHLNNICFRFNPTQLTDATVLNSLNNQLLEKLNETGEIYLSHTKLNSNYVLRLVIAQTNVTAAHVEKTWKLIQEISMQLKAYLDHDNTYANTGTG